MPKTEGVHESLKDRERGLGAIPLVARQPTRSRFRDQRHCSFESSLRSQFTVTAPTSNTDSRDPSTAVDLATRLSDALLGEL